MDLDIREELQKKEEINKRQERELIAAYEKLQVAISMAGIIFCEYDIKRGLFIFRTENYKKIGLHSEVLTVAEVEADMVTIWPEDNYKILDALKALQNGEPYVEIECRMWTENGYRWHKGVYNGISEEGEKPESAFICFYDIHETKMHELESNSRAEKDLMTGLFNRKTFENIVTENMEKRQEDNACGVFLLIDIDNFKHVNDNYGHSFGDEVITYIGNALQEIFLKDAFVARMGGDEFGIFVLDTADREKITGDVEKFYYIVDGFSNTQNKNISCSVGIAFQEEPSDTFSCLYKKADEALYMAKYLGKGQYFVHGDNVRVLEQEEDTMITSDIKQATNGIIDIFLKCAPNSMMFVDDLNTSITRWTAAAVDYFNLPGEYIREFDQLWVKKIHPDDVDSYAEDMMDVQEGRKNKHCCEYRVKNKYNEYVWVHCEGRVFHDDSRNLHIFMGMLNNYGSYMNFDITASMHRLSRLHQDISEIINRRVQNVSLIIFGIDHFKQINDNHGYAYGNLVLRELAKYITGQQGDKERFYKLESDRFACMIMDSNMDRINSTFEKCKAIGENIMVGNRNIKLSLTGAAITDLAKFREGYEAFSCVENTLKYAKEKNRGSLVVYSNNLRKLDEKSKIISKALERSLENNCRGFLLYYQPQIDANTGELFGAEALLRFYDEEIGMVYPDQFIPVLENSGNMTRVGKWVLKTALEQMQSWFGHDIDKTISVNVSYMQFLEEGFIDYIKQEVERLSFPSDKLIIELTESCNILDFKSLKEDIIKLKENNIQFALDDFGTGYASISVLRELPVDWMKIEHSFVAEILEREEDKIIIEYLVKMSKAMGISICIEGIENREVMNIVEKYKPDTYQGYYFDRPMKAEAFYEKYIEGRIK